MTINPEPLATAFVVIHHLPKRQDLEPEERELITRLSAIYQERLSQAMEQGVQQGIQQGGQPVIANALQRVIRTLCKSWSWERGIRRFSPIRGDFLNTPHLGGQKGHLSRRKAHLSRRKTDPGRMSRMMKRTHSSGSSSFKIAKSS